MSSKHSKHLPTQSLLFFSIAFSTMTDVRPCEGVPL
jgi:hypothetical protein